MRLPSVEQRDVLPEDKRHIYDYLAETRGAVRPPFSVLMNHPDVCYLVSQVGTFARFKSALTKDVIETATLTAAREFDCRFEWAAHVPQAKNAGVGDNVIAAIDNKGDVAGLDDKAALVIRYVRQVLHDHRVDDATWSAVNHSNLSASRCRTLIFWLPNISEVRGFWPGPGLVTFTSMPRIFRYHSVARAT